MTKRILSHYTFLHNIFIKNQTSFPFFGSALKRVNHYTYFIYYCILSCFSIRPKIEIKISKRYIIEQNLFKSNVSFSQEDVNIV